MKNLNNEYCGMPGGMGSSASKRLRADYDDEEYLKIKGQGQSVNLLLGEEEEKDEEEYL